MMRVFLLVLTVVLATAVEAEEGTALFPRPAGLTDAVAFWTRVYTEVDTKSGFIHDSRHLGVVYETVRFGKGASRRSRNRQVNRIKESYQSILLALAGGKRNNLTAEEARVLSLWPKNVSNSTLKQAAYRLRFQLGQSDKFRSGLIRSGEWMDHIRKTFSERGLPTELAVLPHVESSFDPTAYSKVGAAGMWQFTRSTGRRFMQVDHVVDERMDPYLATEAAASLLESNHANLRSWPLAITAYNHGVSGMRRAVRQQGTDDIEKIVQRYKSRTFGFASRNFYVAFLAALDVDANAEKYFGKLSRNAPGDAIMVKLPDYLTVDTVRENFGVATSTLKRHNPALMASVWSGSKYIPKGFTLRLPKTALQSDPAILLARIADDERFAQQKPDVYHTVRRGDTLSRIATRYGSSVSELVALNGLRSRHRIRAGQVLRLPVTDGSSIVLAKAEEVNGKPESPPADGVYVVRRGDTLERIAHRYGMNERELAAANDIRNRHLIYPGQQLRVAQAAETSTGEAPAALATVTATPEASSEEPVKVAAIQKPAASDKSTLSVSNIPEAALPTVLGEALSEVPEQAEEADSGVEKMPVDSEEEEDAFEVNSLATAQPVLAADPSDYTVADDGTIEVQAMETLGHYADWLEIRTQRLRDVNRMRFGKPVVIGRRLKLDFSHIDRDTFELRRIAYHRELQDAFFLAHHIKDTQSHVVKRGESIWILAQRRYKVPVWLLRQYNPDLNLDKVHPGTAVNFPVLETVTVSTNSATST